MSNSHQNEDQQAQLFAREFNSLFENVETVIVGKSETVRLALMCLFAEGHLLLEDRPGSGKTVLAKTIASSIEGLFARVQFTPDLLPADITGGSIYNQGSGSFEFRPGPVFANLVLGDEINRGSPKTQSALLEVMEERQVTVDGKTYAVPRPFMVVATQNPIEFAGTYPLPEAQLDRFLMQLSLGYLDASDEVDVLKRHGSDTEPVAVSAVTSSNTVRTMISLAERIHVESAIQRYIVAISQSTRDFSEVRLGASTRASLAVQRAARVHAAAKGRAYVSADDVKAIAGPVLAHRIRLNPDAANRGTVGSDIVQRVLREIDPPATRY